MGLFQQAEFLPQSLAQLIKTATPGEFRSSFTGTRLLLIRLDRKLPDLVHGLTDVLRIEGSLPTPTLDGTAEMHAVTAEDPADEVDVSQLEFFSKLEDQPHFILPLLKRQDPSLDEFHITVGRSTKNDVVLVDPAVSARHAHFRLSGASSIELTDDDSRNGTYLNGKKLTPSKPAYIQPADQIRFGNVVCFICEPALLRRMLRLADVPAL